MARKKEDREINLLFDEIPQIIKDVGFDFDWSEGKVWALDVPVEEMSTEELVWHFDIPFWNEGGAYNLKPRDVIEHPDARRRSMSARCGPISRIRSILWRTRVGG